MKATFALMAAAICVPFVQAQQAKTEDKKPRLVVVRGWRAAIGETANIVTRSGDPLYVATNSEGHQRLRLVARAKDRVGVGKLVEQGSVVAAPDGTPVLLLKAHESSKARQYVSPGGTGRLQSYTIEDVSSWQARILDGEHKDKVVVVESENLAKLVNPSETASAKKKALRTFNPESLAKRASNAFRAAKALETAGKTQDAVAAYRKLTTDYPAAPEARMAQARIKALTGK